MAGAVDDKRQHLVVGCCFRHLAEAQVISSGDEQKKDAELVTVGPGKLNESGVEEKLIESDV